MGLRLVPKSMTLNDLERRNGRHLRCSTKLHSLRPITSKWSKIDPYCLRY